MGGSRLWLGRAGGFAFGPRRVPRARRKGSLNALHALAHPAGPPCFPERFLHLVESVEARQPHIRQVAFTEPLDVIPRLSATPPLREQHRQLAPVRQATQRRNPDAKRYHGSLRWGARSASVRYYVPVRR